MKYKKQNNAVVLLEDGTIFHGKSVGISGIATGEICFNTGMTGYQGVFTDPSYYGQLMITTNAHIGNYGVHADEVESDSMKIAGLICKNFNNGFSREGAEGNLNQYFQKQNKVVVADVDTRALVRYIRDKGAMNAIISTETTDINALQEQLEKVPSMEGLELSSKVTTEKPYFFGNKNAKYKVAVLDLGVKRNILRCLADRDCYLQVFPMHASYQETNAWNPEGFFLSNGPGDPSTMPNVIQEVKKITEDGMPVFGICLGHQIIARAFDSNTYKLKFGHRGGNQPVMDIKQDKVYITAQNHGYAVSSEIVNPEIEITHINLNDNTVSGLKHKKLPIMGIQYHSEASPGPKDNEYLFDEFIKMININRNNI